MFESTLRFHQLNCHKRELANELLNNHNTVLKNGIFVGLCQELGLDQGKIREFDEQIEIFQGCKVNLRACIVIDERVNYIMLNQYCD